MLRSNSSLWKPLQKLIIFVQSFRQYFGGFCTPCDKVGSVFLANLLSLLHNVKRDETIDQLANITL